MSLFALNLVLAATWAFATGSLSELNLAIGFVVGMVVLHFVGGAVGDSRYAVRLFRAVALLGIFLRELVLSSVRVAIDVLRDIDEDAAITLLANLISLTPGTLSIDVADDRSCLYVHAMYGGDPDALALEIKRTFERRIREVFR